MKSLHACLPLMLLACSSNRPPDSAAPAQTSAMLPFYVPPDTAAATRASQLARARQEIKGRESQPSESVYRDIRILKGVPAGRLLAIMDIGYSRSLGVNCSHCHVADHWEREDSTRKQVARQMSAMAKVINTELLKKVDSLRSEHPVINCTTCHRGNIKPALDLVPEPPKGGG